VSQGTWCPKSRTLRSGESRAGQLVAEQGAGTGFVVTVDEVIAVNDHVVAGAQTIAVPLAGGRTLPARVRRAGSRGGV
jgi:S1-C subfamily serine protease